MDCQLPFKLTDCREGLAETPASFRGYGVRRLIYANTSEICVFRLTTRVRRKITGEFGNTCVCQTHKGVSGWKAPSFSASPSLFPSLSQRKEGEGVVKWKGDVRTVVSVGTRRVSIARGLSTMQEMQVWYPGCEYSPGNPLQDSCLDNPIKRGTWRAM